VTRKPVHVALLAIFVLWCALLAVGAVIYAFIGMLFAGEPAGGGMGLREFLQASLPLLQTAALSAVLVTLWLKRYYIWAAVAWLLSVIFVVYHYHGYVL
jgi:hypothetical protein